jgi:hypothetical protein
MNTERFETPIVLCVYNRPHLTQQVLESLRSLNPPHILVIADGPKLDDPIDRMKCREVIQLFKSTIDWPTRIEWNVSTVNLGCRRRLQTGLSWAFRRVEEAIVLEDDCVPHSSFFRFCSALLKHYRLDPRIALICGSSLQTEADCEAMSYVFSRYPLIWGWAGWRRTWELYDPDINAWSNLRDTSWLSGFLSDPVATLYWRHIFDQVRSGLDTWDYSMTFSCWRAGALAVHPSQNLTRNIGFGDGATHTRERSVFANMPVHAMSFPLVHPHRVEPAQAYDKRIERVMFSGRIKERIWDMFHRRSESTKRLSS